MIKKALLIIDMLNDFIRENGKLYIGDSGRKIISPIQKELERFRKENPGTNKRGFGLGLKKKRK